MHLFRVRASCLAPARSCTKASPSSAACPCACWLRPGALSTKSALFASRDGPTHRRIRKWHTDLSEFEGLLLISRGRRPLRTAWYSLLRTADRRTRQLASRLRTFSRSPLRRGTRSARLEAFLRAAGTASSPSLSRAGDRTRSSLGRSRSILRASSTAPRQCGNPAPCAVDLTRVQRIAGRLRRARTPLGNAACIPPDAPSRPARLGHTPTNSQGRH